MTNREQRRLLAESTLSVMRSGRLGDIDISEIIQQSVAGTCSYPETDLVPQPLKRSSTYSQTKFHVINTTTLDGAKQLKQIDPNTPVAVLNFASAMYPGGGFLKGAQAQEESLAVNSCLYACIRDDPMYSYHHQMQGRGLGGLYSDWTIYSPNVPVIRSERTGRLLEFPWLYSVLTCPCINISRYRPSTQQELERLLLKRMDRFLSVLAAHHRGNVVLGAWGCGVFGNDPAMIARLFAILLRENETFVNRWPNVVFAIFSKTHDALAPFEREFLSLNPRPLTRSSHS